MRQLSFLSLNGHMEYHLQGKGEGIVIGSVLPLPLPVRHIELELTNSDPHAVAYIVGKVPNFWGNLLSYVNFNTNISNCHCCLLI